MFIRDNFIFVYQRILFLFIRQFYFCLLDNFIFAFSVFLILIQLYVQVFNYIVLLFITFLQALVHWCAHESCFVVLVQAPTISLAWVSGWTVTAYLFAVGWLLFKHLLLSSTESGAVHCSLFISLFNFTVVRINLI